MNEKYYFDDKTFVIQDYNKQKPFASFLPGIAGKKGIPMWCFYVNRGQAVSSFGLRDKNGPILEFSPANTAYQNTDRIGFRTFVKLDGTVIEVFGHNDDVSVNRVMNITKEAVEIVETNQTHQFQMTVRYFTLPNEGVAGLIRRVTFTDLSDTTRAFEIADGVNQLIPLGISNAVYKEMSNLFRSFVEVQHLEDQYAYLKVKASTGDTAEVKQVEEGSFYVSYVNGIQQAPLIDKALLYEHDTSFTTPYGFIQSSVRDIMASPQVDQNKFPCGFTLYQGTLSAGETVRIDTLIGAAKTDCLVEQLLSTIDSSYFDRKQEENKQVIDELLTPVATKSAFPIFDEYVKQNQLDNVLRGGYPFILESKNKDYTYHLYSRKHGDLERDYNFFVIEPEFYSQGNANFRDVCQNRRNDVYFEPRVYDANVHMFASLIQHDGYNPLSVMGLKFTYTGDVNRLCKDVFKEHADLMVPILSGLFSPGDVMNALRMNDIELDMDDATLFEHIMSDVEVHYQSAFGEGYWIDHFTYILDLVENTINVYPDRLEELVFKRQDYRFFLSPATVYPKTEKMVQRSDGAVRQYGAINHYDKEKVHRLELQEGTNWMKNQHGHPVETNLFGKLFMLVVNKISQLDPYGLGIEMEADKPGWNDAMNGLPGLFGSGTSETFEILRVARFLQSVLEDQPQQEIPLIAEFVPFMKAIEKVLDESPMDYWHATNDIRDAYMKETRFGASETVTVHSQDITSFVHRIVQKLENAVEQIKALDAEIVPTFLTYEATEFEVVQNEQGIVYTHYGMPKVHVNAFELQSLPAFLEAPARLLKISTDTTFNKQMVQSIKQSGVYDATLKMYKTSDDLTDASFEIGRIKAFSKGWLERESNFLHMTYKYLYGLLKSGLYDEFYQEIETNLVCFMDPEVYGRSTLENSSFIATSNNPDPALHGQGFVARLSGSTAEMLSIWSYMMMGPHPFIMDDNKLTLNLKPVLQQEWFDDQHQVQFRLLNQVTVTYVNETGLATYDDNIMIDKILVDGVQLNQPKIQGNLAQQVRNGDINTITIYWKKQ
ncbi:cellobiose phosphorylase [Candidatus Xianfuyuplasma coldseepsis]|uniref:Cellobiose phosphorylase n=1 Tax=Candidatus Xianfuyuplasma coldseepsis TaxID=2782163 RepID=A0A7L7KQE1_9MOLU|nr:cellobiose phosphorylase [Xianfuyuplasma coldseepsis]QMS84436.1 cellobiose phosphorylase [Xianfuyuplasma coldseepsis]